MFDFEHPRRIWIGDPIQGLPFSRSSRFLDRSTSSAVPGYNTTKIKCRELKCTNFSKLICQDFDKRALKRCIVCTHCEFLTFLSIGSSINHLHVLHPSTICCEYSDIQSSCQRRPGGSRAACEYTKDRPVSRSSHTNLRLQRAA